MRRLRSSRGPLLAAIWFFAPAVQVQQDEVGEWSIALGGTVGQYEDVTRGCSGEFLSSRAVPVTNTGAVVEFEPRGAPVRLSAFSGFTSESRRSFGDGDSYYGGLLAWEANRIGLGLGAVYVPSDVPVEPKTVAPSMYLRIGDRPGGSFQADFFAPTPTPGATGLFRVGARIEREEWKGFFGISTLRSLAVGRDSDNGGPFAEVELPLSPHLDLTLAGSFWEFEKHPDWGAGVGARFRF